MKCVASNKPILSREAIGPFSAANKGGEPKMIVFLCASHRRSKILLVLGKPPQLEFLLEIVSSKGKNFQAKL